MSKSEQDSLGVLEVLIIFGFTSFFAWYFLTLIGYPCFFPAAPDPFFPRVVQFMFFIGMIAGSIFALWKPKDYEKTAYSTVKTVSWALVSCLVPIFVMLESVGIRLPLPVSCLAMGATGFGAGYFMTGWENLCSRNRMTDILVSMGMSMVIALVLFLVIMLFMNAIAQGVMGIVLGLLQAVLFYGAAKRRHEYPAGAKKKASKQAADAEEKDDDAEERISFNKKLTALLFMTNVPLGYGLALVYLYDEPYLYIAVAIALVALVAFVLVMRMSKVELTFINLLRISVGASAIAFLIVGIYNPLSIVASTMLFAVWLVLRLGHSVIILKLTNVQKAPPVYLAVRAKQPGYIGFAAGFLAAVLIIACTDGRPALAIGGLVIVAVLVVAALLFFPFSDSYAQKLALIPVVIDTSASTAEDIEHAKVAELAKRFNLSPREEEILFYIVRGRNAKFIAEKLVISESTAKTHIHNIYKKSGIHSQQKFIDIMDEFV